MDEVVKAIDRQQDEISVNTECDLLVHPDAEKVGGGKSVGYIMRAVVRHRRSFCWRGGRGDEVQASEARLRASPGCGPLRHGVCAECVPEEGGGELKIEN